MDDIIIGLIFFPCVRRRGGGEPPYCLIKRESGVANKGIQTSFPLLCVQALPYPTYGEKSLVVYSIGKWNFNSEETQWLMGIHTYFHVEARNYKRPRPRVQLAMCA